jgi:hypothetical protein
MALRPSGDPAPVRPNKIPPQGQHSRASPMVDPSPAPVVRSPPSLSQGIGLAGRGPTCVPRRQAVPRPYHCRTGRQPHASGVRRGIPAYSHRRVVRRGAPFPHRGRLAGERPQRPRLVQPPTPAGPRPCCSPGDSQAHIVRRDAPISGSIVRQQVREFHSLGPQIHTRSAPEPKGGRPARVLTLAPHRCTYDSTNRPTTLQE